MKKLLTALSCILVSLISNGQENETPGFIIQHDGDTLDGYIDYRNWDKNPSALAFKVNKDDAYQIFSPQDISGYGVENEVYKSATVDTEVSPDDEMVLTTDPNISTIKVSVFLQELIRGEKGLYYFVNQVGKNQFYIYHDRIFELLVYKRYYKEINYRYVVAEINQFIGQLVNYMNDCPEILRTIEKAEYSSSDLKNVFIKYHSLKGINIDFNRKNKKLQIDIGVLAGAYSTSLDFNNIGKSGEIDLNRNNLSFYKDFHPDNYIAFTPGIFVDIIWPYAGRKWSLHNELTYQKYKSSGTVVSMGYGTRYDILFDQSNLRLNNLMRYTHPINDFNIFLNAGVANTLGSKVKDGTYKIDLETNEIQESINAFKNLTGNFAFLVGAGASYKNFSLEFRIERFRNKAADSYIEKRLHTNHVFLNYRLNTKNTKKIGNYLSTQVSSLQKKYLIVDLLEAGLIVRKTKTNISLHESIVEGVPSNLTHFRHLDLDMHSTYSPGIYLNIKGPFVKRRLSLQNELTLISYKVSSQVNKDIFGNNYIFNYDHKQLRLSSLIRYSQPIKDFNIFANAGMATTLKRNSNDSHFVTHLASQERTKITECNDITMGEAFLVGLGCSYKKLSLEYRYEQYKIKPLVSSVTHRVTKNHILLSYKLKLFSIN